MAYDGQERVKRIATFGVYELNLAEGDRAAFDGDPAGSLTRFLAEEGQPAPNEVVVRKQPASLTHDAGDDLIAQIVMDLRGGGGATTAPPDPPQALVFHQESGALISRYITIVLSQ
jgi:hypothetical protein